MPANFVHLKVHSEFSLVNGLVRIKPLASTLGDLSMPAMALTDQSNLCALVKFYKAMRGAGIKPIVGSCVWIENPDDADQPFRMTLLAKNAEGYRNLTELISLGYTQGQAQGRPVLTQAWVENAASGLIALSGAKEGDVGRALLSGKCHVAVARLARWMRVFPSSFYLELQCTLR